MIRKTAITQMENLKLFYVHMYIHNHASSTFDNHVTFTFDLLTSVLMHCIPRDYYALYMYVYQVCC